MISVSEARTLLTANMVTLPTEQASFPDLILRYTAETTLAPYDHPLFDQSAVDGYALAWDPGVHAWDMVGEVGAGTVLDHALAPGQCVRIFTGAQLPLGADTVVMQEFVQREDLRVTHRDGKLRLGANVRKRGEHVGKGQTVLPAGSRLTPQAVGLLRSVGVQRSLVGALPRIALVITGNEFTDPADPKPGHIFSSNGDMLRAGLQLEGLSCTIYHAADDVDALREVLHTALQAHDLVITTGGVSVGDLDLVRPTLEHLGTHIIFHKVAQKPGKPMLLGRWQDRLVLGLPGNPRAVLVLFWMYVLPALRAMQGASDPWLPNEFLPMAHGVDLKGDRAEFRAAQVNQGQVRLLRDEGSHMLASLLNANALVLFPEGARQVLAGQVVEVHYLPR